MRAGLPVRAMVVVAFVVVMALLPFVLRPLAVTLLNYIGIATLVALGLVLLTGSGGLTSFGQAAFVGIGAYTTGYLTTAAGLSPWLGLVAALVITAVIATFIGGATLHLGGHYLPLTTIAWGLSIYLLFGNFEALGRYGGLGHIPTVGLFGLSLDRMDQIYYLIWLLTGLCMLAAANLFDSREAIRALRGGAVLVESLGISAFRTKLVLFVIASLLAALAGWLYAHMQKFISPATFDLRAGIEYLLMAVLGGAGSISGAIVGAALVIVVKDWLQALLPLVTSQGGNLEAVAFGVVFIVLLQYSPRGIVPWLARFLPAPKPAAGLSSCGHVDGAASSLPQRAMPERGTPLLAVDGITRMFGGLTAVDDVSFTVEAGTILALIGPNGAGESTTFNLITGVLPVTSGRIRFLGKDVTGLSQRGIAGLGIARTFQHVKLRPTITVVENVMLGAHRRTRSGFLSGCLRLDRAEEAAVRQLALEKLKEVGLADKSLSPAGALPLGQQRLVEIARALAADPVVIMLDEPAAGLRAREKQALAALLKALRARGVTILLVEHDMPFLMGLADRVVVLNFGQKIAEGAPADVRKDKDVQLAYLGGDA